MTCSLCQKEEEEKDNIGLWTKENIMIAWIKKKIRTYFGFSKRETNGVVLLLCITSIIVLVPFAMYCYDMKYEKADEHNEPVLVEGKDTKPVSQKKSS